MSQPPIAAGPGLECAIPRGGLAPFCTRPATAVAVLGLTLTFVFFTHVPLWHTDVWGHLRFGEAIAREGRLPEREGFSGDFADQDKPYIHFQWLTQLALYRLFELGGQWAGDDEGARLAGGALLLCTGHAAVVALRFALLMLAFRRLTGSLSWALVGVAGAAALAYFNHLGIQRPQALGEAAFAAVLLAVSRPILSRRAVALVPLVFALWANLHGSFVVGLVLLGMVLAGKWLEAGWRDRAVRRLALTLALSCMGAMLNPHGPALFWHSLQLANHPNIATLEEWKPLAVKGPAGMAFLVGIGLLATLLRLSPSRFTPTQVLLLLGFGLQTLAHARMMVWWCMVFPWVALPHLQATVGRFLARHLQSPPDLRWTLGTVLGVPLLLAWSAPAQWLLAPRGPDGASPVLQVRRVSRDTPVQAARLLRQELAAAPHGVVFASETMGDYLLWELRGNPPVRLSSYTHLHLLKPDHWQRCMTVKFGDAKWQEALDGMGAEFVVVEYGLYNRRTGISDLIDQIKASPRHWQVLEEQPVFVARRTPPVKVP